MIACVVIAQFAAANNGTYSVRVPGLPTRQPHPPAWYGLQLATTRPLFVHEVKGRWYGYDMVFCHTLTPIGASKRSSTDQPEEVACARRSIIRVTLPKLFPQIVLESNKNDRGMVSSMPTSIKSHQKVSLEGDFGHYFDLFMPTGMHLNALTLLAPNFMQTLMSSSHMFDVEFYGQEMILTTKESIYDPEVMNKAGELLQIQLTYLTRLMSSWNYQPLRAPFDQLEYGLVSGEVIKVGSWRISPGWLIVFILTAMIGSFLVASLVLGA